MTNRLDNALMCSKTLHLHQLGCALSTPYFFYLLVLVLSLVGACSFCFGRFQVALHKELSLFLLHMIVAEAVALRALVRFLSYWCYKCDLLKSFGRRFLKILRRCTGGSRIGSCIRTCLLSLYFDINCAVRLSGCYSDQVSLS